MGEVDARFRRGRCAAHIAIDQPLVEMAEHGELVLLIRLYREVQRFTTRPRVAANRWLGDVLRVGNVDAAEDAAIRVGAVLAGGWAKVFVHPGDEVSRAR
jgi:hypothetical protein